MGNRAVIQFKDGTGIYLHWNGGPESVLAFLDAAKTFKLRNDDYGQARLIQLIGNFFGGSLSLGVGEASTLDRDNGDNGTYHVDENFNITRRDHNRSKVKEVADLDDDELKQYSGVLEECIAVNKAIFERGQ